MTTDKLFLHNVDARVLALVVYASVLVRVAHQASLPSQSSPSAGDFDLVRVPLLLLRTRVRVTAPIAGAPVWRAGSLEPKWLPVAPS